MTVSKKLLLYYNPDEKDLFASQDTKDNKYEKNKAIHNEDKLLWVASRKLPKKGQDRIWKEIGLDRMFSKENLPLKNNTTNHLTNWTKME